MANERIAVIKVTANTDGVTAGTNKAASAFDKLGVSGTTAGSKIQSGLSKLGNMIGGETGHLIGELGDGIEKLGEHGMSMGAKMAAAGGMVTALGVGLMALGSADKQASDQLSQAIDNTGNSFSDFKDEIDKTITSQEGFGHSAVDTQEALRKMTQATNDPTRALGMMGLAANLAAAQHISLSDAADKLDKIMAGKGGRTLAAYGITMKKGGDATKNAQDAIDQLSKKIDGQADASVDNFGAKVNIMRVRLQDAAAQFGNTFGPVITAAGGALMVFGSILDVKATLGAKKAAEAIAADAVALDGEAASATAAGTATAGFGSSMLSLAGPVAAAVAVIVGLGKAAALAEDALGHGASSADQFGAAFKTGLSPDQIKEVTAALQGPTQQAGLFGAAAKAMGGDVIGAMTDLFHGTDTLKNFDTALAGLVKGGNAGQAADYLKSMGISAETAAERFPQYAAALKAAGGAGKDAAGGVGSFKDMTSQATDAAKRLSDAASALNNNLDALKGTIVGSETATMDVRAAFDAATAAAAKNGKTLDLNTAAGRANRQSLIDLASKAISAASAYAKNGESVDSVRKKTQTARDEFIKAAGQMGLNATQAGVLADRYGLIPGKVATAVTNSGFPDAKTAADNLTGSINSIPKNPHITAGTSGVVSATSELNGLTDAVNSIPNSKDMTVSLHVVADHGVAYYQYATGGYVSGPGTGSSDSIPARLSNGEYVLNADTVSKLGVGFLDSLNYGKTKSGSSGRGGMAAVGGGGPTYVTVLLDGKHVAAAVRPSLVTEANKYKYRNGVTGF